jgi:predicted anti-sigma-YlaC factor YlaD
VKRMNCRKVERLLLEYQDQRLPMAIAGGVAAHLAGCADCRARAAAFERTRELLAANAVPAPVDSERFLQDVRRRIRRSSPEPARRRFGWPVAIPAAAALLLLVATVLVKTRSTHNPVTAESAAVAVLDESDDFNPLAGSVGHEEALKLTSGLETRLIEETDFDDLVDGLTPTEQAQLVNRLKEFYQYHGG